jgi:hypothetical protein
MKKVVSLLMKILKNLYGKKEKHIYWVTVTIKSFLNLSRQKHNFPMRKNRLWYQVSSSGVDNDKINQCANVINQQNNVDPPMRKLKGRQQENFMIINHWINKLSKVHIQNLWLKMCWPNKENVIDWIHAILQIKWSLSYTTQ